MAGSTVHARAIISATDNASSVFRQIAAAGQSAMRSLSAGSGVVGSMRGNLAALNSKMQSTAALSMAMPSALSIGSLGHNTYEWEKALHQYRAITEITPAQLGGIKTAITGVSNATGVSAMELVDAAKGWVELGNAPETFIENAEVAARTSRIVGVSVAEQMKESSALLRAFKGSDWNKNDFKHFEEVYLVASKGMKGGAHAFGEAMKMWAPVAASLGLTIEQASAFAQTLGGQFQPTEIGNALKTGFMRLSAPVPKSAAAMRFAGIDEATLYNIDRAKLNPAQMAEGFRGAGFNVTPAIEKRIAETIAAADLSKGTNGLVDSLRGVLTESFGTRTKTGKYTMAARDAAVVQQAILSLVGNSKTGLNTSEFFKQFGPHANNLAFMSTVFGKEHAPKIMDLLKQGEHYAHNLEKILKQSDGALANKWGIYAEGFAFQWDKVTSAFDNLMKSVGGSGVAGDMTKAMEATSEFFRGLQDADPDKVRALFYAAAGISALPVAAIGIASLTTVIGALANPVVLATAALAGLGVAAYKAYQNWDDIKAAWGGDRDARDRLMGWGKYADDNNKVGAGGLKPLSLYSLDEIHGKSDALARMSAWLEDWSDRLSGTGKWNVTPEPVGAWGPKPLRLMTDELQQAGHTVPLIRDGDVQQIDITGKVQADVQGTVSGKMELDIRVHAPPGFAAAVERMSGGDVRGDLNSGKSMPDTGTGQ